MKYVFADCSLDPARRELRCAGRDVVVEPQVFDLLEYLVRHRDRVVSLDELLAAVWKGRVVSESTLSSRISIARQAVGDSGVQQRLIRTFPRKGYRFIAESREEQHSEEEAGQSAADPISAPADTGSDFSGQTVSFCQTPIGINLAVATIGSGPVLVRVGHWATHVQYDLQNPLTGPLLQRLARNFQLVRYDGRGMGLSDRNVAGVSFATFCEDLEAVVDTLGAERFTLLGMHGAAAVAIAFAARHAQRVSNLVLYGGYAQGPYLRRATADAEWSKAMTAILGTSRDRPEFIRAFSALWLPSGTAEQIRWFTELASLSMSAEMQREYAAAIGSIDVVKLLPKVESPTLVFHCTRDHLVNFDEGRRLAYGIPGARFVPLDSDNHALLSTESAWTQMVEEIEAFATRFRD